MEVIVDAMKKYILIFLLIIPCFIQESSAGQPRLVKVRIIDWVPGNTVKPQESDFSWSAWLNGDKSETINKGGTYKVVGPDKNGAYKVTLDINLQYFKSWETDGSSILNMEVTYNDGGVIKTTKPWDLQIRSNPSSTIVDTVPAKFLIFPAGPQPTIALNLASFFVCDKSTVDILATVANAPAGYTINWVNSSYASESRLVAGTDKATATGFPPGTYPLHAVLMNGATPLDTADFTLQVGILPVVKINTANPGIGKSCSGEEFTLTASGAINGYSWKEGVTDLGKNNPLKVSPTITGTAVVDKTYTVTGTTGVGSGACHNTATFTLSVSPKPTVNVVATPNAGTPGISSVLAVNLTPTPPTATFTWPAGVTDNALITPTATGGNVNNLTTRKVYTFTAEGALTTNGLTCTARNTATVTISGNALSVQSNSFDLCEGATKTISTGAKDGAGVSKYKYKWDAPSSSDLVLTGAVTDATRGVAAASKPGTYTVGFEVDDDITKERGTATVIVKKQLTLSNIDPVTKEIAKNTSVMISVVGNGGAIQPQWTPTGAITGTPTGSSITTVSLTATTVFTVTLTDPACCPATPMTSTITVSTSEPLSIDPTIDNATICQGDNATLNLGNRNGDAATRQIKWMPVANGSGNKVTLSQDNIPNPSVTNTATLQPGTYDINVEAWDKYTTPHLTGKVTLTVKQKPALSNIAADKTSGTPGLVVNLSVDVVPNDGSATVTWKGGMSGDLPTPATGTNITTNPLLANGKHSFTAEANLNGCKANIGPVDVTISGGALATDPKGGDWCQGVSMQLRANATGGGANKTYTWIPQGALTLSATDIADPLVTTTTPGNYTATLTVSDGITTEGPKTVNIKVKQQPRFTNITATPPSGTPGIEVTLSATVENPTSASSSINWSGGPLQANVGSSVKTGKLAATTVYTAAVDLNGCTADTTVTVTIDGAELKVTPQGGSWCEGEEMILAAGQTGGSGTYTWNWEVDPATPGLVLENYQVEKPKISTVTPPAAQPYRVKVTVNDGLVEVVSAYVNVIVKEMPKFTDLKANPSSILKGEFSVLSVKVAPAVTPVWSPAGSLESTSGLSVTTKALNNDTWFYVTAASAAGCTKKDSVMVSVGGDQLSATATGGNPACAGIAFQLEVLPKGGTRPYRVKWTPPTGINLSDANITNPVVTNSATLAAGTYQIPVLVTDEAGKTATAFATITVLGKIKAAGLGICDATSPDHFDAEVEITGGTAPYAAYRDAACTQEETGFVWDNAAGKGKMIGLTSKQNYTYYVRDAHQCNTEIVKVTADCSCGAQLTMSVDKKPCANSGEDVTITIVATGGNSYSFDLLNEFGGNVKHVVDETDGSWTHLVDYAGRGKYRIVNFKAKTNAITEGCDGNVIVPEVNVDFNRVPVINPMNDIIACGSDKIVLTATGDPGLKYGWDKNVQNGVPFQPENGTTVYTVEGKDVNGCSATASVTVTVNPKPTVFADGNPKELCRGESVTLTAGGSATEFVWNNGAGTGMNVTVQPQQPTTYVVTGTDPLTHCSATDTVRINVKPMTEIVEVVPSTGIKNIAIGRDAKFSVKAIGGNVTYKWQKYDAANAIWIDLYDDATSTPGVRGAQTAELTLTGVPREYDGSQFKVIVHGDCGNDPESVFTLNVRECFDISGAIYMGRGIQVDDDPTDRIDGWFCQGTEIELNSEILSDDPSNSIESPRYQWYIDDNRKVGDNSPVLKFVPEDLQDENDIHVWVCVYSDGACEEFCTRHLTLKARPAENVTVKIVADAIEPNKKFCPGDAIDFYVVSQNGGRNPRYLWKNDVFDLQTEPEKDTLNKVLYIDNVLGKLGLEMGQQDSWVEVTMVPSPEVCVAGVIRDRVFLTRKKSINPKMHIENNIGDTIACRGDKILFQVVYEDAGTNPKIDWFNDVWNLGHEQFATAELKDEDMWIRCNLLPGDDACWDPNKVLTDTMVIRAMSNGSVSIAVDMKDKMPGDELTFVSTVENMIGDRMYEWFVNHNRTPWFEKDYMTDILKQGDIVVCAVSGEKVCQERVFSNEILVDYGQKKRDTMVTIYQGEQIKDLNLFQTGDDDKEFVIMEYPRNGVASINPVHGIFTYKPNKDFIGTEVVKYLVRLRKDRNKYEEGYVFITVKEGGMDELPNIITPDGNGLNDVWDLSVVTENNEEYSISVYDRDSKLVFQAVKRGAKDEGYRNDWDSQGKGSGQYYMPYTHLSSGIYTYVIELNRGERKIVSWLEIRAPFNRASFR